MEPIKKKNSTLDRNLALVAGRDLDRVSIKFPGSSSVIRHVEVVGDTSKLAIGSQVPISWQNGRPVVLSAPALSVPSSLETAQLPNMYPYSQLVMAVMFQTSATPIYIANSGCVYGWYFRSDNTVVGTTIDAKLILQAGTYILTLMHLTGSAGGYFDLYLDSNKFEENFPSYSASTVLNIDKKWIVNVPFSGIHNFRAECIGAGGSAGYCFFANFLSMVLQ